MARLIYAPSGHAGKLDDECRDCRAVDFPGEVVMVYNPESRELFIICEACYQRRLDRDRKVEPTRVWQPPVRRDATTSRGAS